MLPYARTAFRRVLGLYGSLELLLNRVARFNERNP